MQAVFHSLFPENDNTMKTRVITYICAVLCAIVFATSSFAQNAQLTGPSSSIAKSAYSRVAPYVNNDTFLVVRIDLDSLDIEKFGSSLSEIFNSYMKERGFDRNSVNATNREFKKTLNVVKEEGEFVLALRDVVGVRELFLVMQKQNGAFRIVTPMASAQREQYIQNFSEKFPDLAISEVNNGVCIDSDKDLADSVYKNFKAEQNVKLKDFLAGSAGSTIQIYCSNLKIKKLIDAANAQDNESLKIDLATLPEETRKGLNSFDSYFQYALISYDFNVFSFKSKYVFTTAEHAEDVRIGLEKIVDLVADRLVKEAQKDADAESVEKYNIDGLARELIRGALLSFIPKRSDAVLVFESNLQTKELLTHPGITSAYLSVIMNQVISNVMELQDDEDVEE